MSQVQTIRTPTGPLALIRPTAEKLLAEGVISGTLDGDLHANDAATVKAAILTHAVCDFCSTPGASHFFDVPDFGVTQHERNYATTRSTGGWAACDECDALIRADKRKQLVARAIETHAFPKFSHRAVEELHAMFWQGMDEKASAAGTAAALMDYVEDTFPPEIGKTPITDRDRRIEGVMRMTHLTRQEVDGVLAGKINRDVVAKLVAFEKSYGKVRDPRATIDRFVNGPQKPLADIVPHWQRALDAKFKALSTLSALLARTSREEYFPDATDLNDPKAIRVKIEMAQKRSTLRDLGFNDDVKYLRAAQAYSFNAETMAAIREASQSVPHDAPLSSIETPNTGAGWFWFGDPMPITASPIASDKVHALLWGWTEMAVREVNLPDDVVARFEPADREMVLAHAGKPSGLSSNVAGIGAALKRAGITADEFDKLTGATKLMPALMFSAYVLDERGQIVEKDSPAPSTRWFWPLSLSFHEMLVHNRETWRASYGPGGTYEGDSNIMGEDATLHCVAELSLFFVMACLWFKQAIPILTRESGHVERHAKKRFVREHKLAEPPTVEVVALRKSLRVPSDEAPTERREGAKVYHCRWIVKGHPRLQACGPGRKDRKLIWIEAHPAGPDDKPLRTRERVFAVIR